MSVRINNGSKSAAASATLIVNDTSGVASTPTPPANPALAIPNRITAAVALSQKAIG